SATSTDFTLSSNENLESSEYLLSQDKQSVLIHQKDGNVVLYRNFKAAWNTRTAGYSTKRLVTQGDGNIVLYKPDGVPIWNSETYGNPGARLVLQTDSNLVIYTPSNNPLWTSSTVHTPNLLSYVNTSLPFNGVMFRNQQIQTA